MNSRSISFLLAPVMFTMGEAVDISFVYALAYLYNIFIPIGAMLAFAENKEYLERTKTDFSSWISFVITLAGFIYFEFFNTAAVYFLCCIMIEYKKMEMKEEAS